MESTAVDSPQEIEKGVIAKIRNLLGMKTNEPEAAPAAKVETTAPAEPQLKLSDLVQQLADFRASVDGRLNTITGEVAGMKAHVDERLKSVDNLTERQANSQSRARLASLGIPAGTSPSANSTAASETIVETYGNLQGASKVKFWRENKAKLLAFRS